MPAPRRPRQSFAQIFGAVLGVLIVAYFLYHTVQGERGWLSMLRSERDVAEAEEKLAALRAQRQELEHRTQLLRDDNMDPDLLDEKARELLNYSKPNEIVILTSPDKKSQE